MSNSGKLIGAIVIVAVIAVGAIVLTSAKSDTKSSTSNTTTNQNATSNTANDPADGTVAATITYDGNSFKSSASSIKSGSKVKVVNSSSKDLDFDSDPHPVHTDNPELNAGDIPAGESKTFTLTTKGTWGYHNHLNSSQKGELAVE